jgi:very-short-patch-repair endonuclease
MVREIRRVRQINSIRAPRTPISVRAGRITKPIRRRGFVGVSELTQEQQAQERRAVPITQVNGTILERIVYKALTDRHIPFDFQSSQQGGRAGWQFGRQVADFALYGQRIIIEVQGAYWHSGGDQHYRDVTRELVLSGEGWTVLYLDEAIILNERALNVWLDSNVVFGAVVHSGWHLTSLSGV